MDLSDDYANGAYVEGSEAYPEIWSNAAARFREETGANARLDVPYGKGARQRFDLFLPGHTPKGLFVFVHGGYWMKFDKSYWSHFSTGLLAHGWAVAMPSYDLCPDVRITDITRQIAQAVECAASEVAGPILIAGHSAGGHLSARMMDAQVLSADVAARVQRVMPISPLSDLRPLMQTNLNETLKIDAEEAQAESPVFTEDRHAAEVVVWVGSIERPAFIQQAHWLGEAWDAEVVVAADKHHFDVIEPLADPASALVKKLVTPR